MLISSKICINIWEYVYLGTFQAILPNFIKIGGWIFSEVYPMIFFKYSETRNNNTIIIVVIIVVVVIASYCVTLNIEWFNYCKTIGRSATP